MRGKGEQKMANEKRLIDANKVRTKAIPLENLDGNGIPYELMAVPVDALDDAPTVDAVEVVRCKGCKHWQHVEDGIGDCTNPRFHLPGHADPTMEHDGFCSCGERKDNE